MGEEILRSKGHAGRLGRSGPRLTWIQATSTRGVRARLRRVAGCATPSGAAGHAGETAILKLNFHLAHSAGADQFDFSCSRARSHYPALVESYHHLAARRARTLLTRTAKLTPRTSPAHSSPAMPTSVNRP